MIASAFGFSDLLREPILPAVDVCFWHKADIAAVLINVRFWG